jgi:hypothetical protein
MRPTADGSWRDSDTGRVQICELRDNARASAKRDSSPTLPERINYELVRLQSRRIRKQEALFCDDKSGPLT